jgi:hypothetical protein
MLPVEKHKRSLDKRVGIREITMTTLVYRIHNNYVDY